MSDWTQAQRDIIERLDIEAECRKLGVRFTSEKPGSGGFMCCYAVDRDENRPSAGVNVKTGSYTDHGNRENDRGFFDLVAHLDSGVADWKAARNRFAVFTGVQLPGKPQPKNKKTGSSSKAKIVATYDYVDESGTLLYQGVRLEPKDFRQRKPDGNNGWSWSIKGVRRVPYRLPELLKSTGPVFICEGEKDTDRLMSAGIISTCNAGGAGKWTEELSEHMKGRDVVILPDNDEPGKQGAEKTAQALKEHAASIRILELPGLPAGGGDVSDWLNAGNNADELFSLSQACDEWSGGDSGSTDKPSITPQFRFGRQLVTEFPEMRPVVIDGICRRGEVVNIVAPPKAGKTWLVTDLALSVASGRKWLDEFEVEQGKVLILDYELHGETSAKRVPQIAEARGLHFDEWADSLAVENFRTNAHVPITQLQAYFSEIESGTFNFVIIDALYRAIDQQESENDNRAMAQVYNSLDALAEQTGATFAVIHHASKGDQSGKDITDVGAGAGSQSRAADTHLILRRHEEENCVVLDGSVRSFKPFEKRVLRWNFPCWHIDPFLDPKNLKRPQPRSEEKQERNDRETTEEIRSILKSSNEPLSVSAIEKKSRFGRGRVQRGVVLMVQDGELNESEKEHQNGKSYPIYEFSGGGTTSKISSSTTCQ